MPDLHQLNTYQYDLPKELIAQYPTQKREMSKLLIVDRLKGTFTDAIIKDLPDLLEKGDSLVFNDTRVVPCRLWGERKEGGKTEIFLLKQLSKTRWHVLARPGRKLPVGSFIKFGEDFKGEIAEIKPDGSREIEFAFEGLWENILKKYGEIPLPQYINRRADKEIDSERYQTVFAHKEGSLAAPTAGLHFSSELLDKFNQKEIYNTKITLHVGLGTFLPVKTDDIRQHSMHTEPFEISSETAYLLNHRNLNKKQIVVGTTCCRALESSVDEKGFVQSGQHLTNIFIYPGYHFKYVRHLLTNFHLPGSTLLMLVCAFGGYELMMEAYKKAVKDKYRFFSYGDAMLIL